MAVQSFTNLIDQSDRISLLNYFENGEGDMDVRPDVTTIDPHVDQNNWPKALVEKICNHICDDGWSIESITFWKSKISFPIHADTRGGDEKNILGKNILIPLEWHGGDASTVVFKNRWSGPQAVFMRKEKSRYRTFIPKKDGTIAEVEDIRLVEDISEFDITMEEFNKIKDTRTKKHKGDPRISDYSLLTEYVSDVEFSNDIQEKYMKHIPLSDLHGLQIDKIIEWEKNTVYAWDRQQLHCSGSGHKTKSMVTIFCNR